jgi:hypothetical protein
VPVSLATDDEAHHFAANIPTPPTTFESPVSTAQRVDHGGDFGVRRTEDVEHAL